MFLKISTIALIPSLILQGYYVKKKTLRLEEPAGERQGCTGTGKKLSILILGDSAAAGVGVAHQDDALLGSMISALKNEYALTWQLNATTGHTTDQVMNAFELIEVQHFDVVITSVGVNDVTKLTSAENWIKKQKKMYQSIQDKFTPELIIATGVPPMHMFPALPNPLGWLFGKYAEAMNQKLEKLVHQNHNMQWIEYDLEQYKTLNLDMAKDGFHPSKEIYQLWAGEIAKKIRAIFQG